MLINELRDAIKRETTTKKNKHEQQKKQRNNRYKKEKKKTEKNGRTLSRVDKSYVYLCWGLPENNLPKTKTGSRVEDKKKNV